ncbi:dihydropteroate synthase [bacterium]|nr:dihydropteroate synthase [bacterium]
MEKKIHSRGKTLDFTKRTGVMGVINVTPDSFSDAGRFIEPEAAVEQGLKMVEQGADIIDIGGESTRPGSESISAQKEIDRIMPVVEGLVNNAVISVDTYKADVAETALEAGIHIINDISAMRFDPRMAGVAKKFNVPVIMMHIKGTPKDMQVNPEYNDLIGEIKSYFEERINYAARSGIPNDNIIIDPGIGFGKRLKDNFIILKRLGDFKDLECPILIGPSRKSFIGNTLNLPSDERVEGTAAAVTAGILFGADIVRVHDVKEMIRVVKIADEISNCGKDD